jgi:hypothetical protein
MTQNEKYIRTLADKHEEERQLWEFGRIIIKMDVKEIG